MTSGLHETGTGRPPVWPQPGAPDLLHAFREGGAVDTTCFAGAWPSRLAATANGGELTDYADRFGLSALWVSHLASFFGFDTRTGNESLLDVCAADNRLRPFLVVNPAEPGWERELDWARSVGAQGIRLSPGYHCYELNTGPVDELRAAAHEVALPLHVLLRLDDQRVRHPHVQVVESRVDQLADFLRPAGRAADIVVSGLNRGEWGELQGHLGGDAEGVLADLWFVNGPTGVVDEIGREGLQERFCFGSAYPVQTPEATALQLCVADLSPGQRHAIFRGNVERVQAGIDSPSTSEVRR